MEPTRGIPVPVVVFTDQEGTVVSGTDAEHQSRAAWLAQRLPGAVDRGLGLADEDIGAACTALAIASARHALPAAVCRVHAALTN